MAGQPLSRGRSRGRHRRQVGEINVTPMVDVMLVLLIIFMVTAPLLTVGVPVNLPETQAKALDENIEPLTISIDKKGIIYLQETTVSLEGLIPRLQAITGVNPEARIYVRGDEGIAYGKVMKVMAGLNMAGYKKVALLTKSPKSNAKKGRRSRRG